MDGVQCKPSKKKGGLLLLYPHYTQVVRIHLPISLVYERSMDVIDEIGLITRIPEEPWAITPLTAPYRRLPST